MDGCSISEVAERTGFPASTLRFYEQAGLVRPARTPAGYRDYDDHDIDRLRFIGRAKRFGLTLEEITDVLGLLDEDRCAPVQDRLGELVATRIAEAQTTIADLVAFTAELQRVAAALEVHTPDGPCDDGCGCTTEPSPAPPEALAVRLVTPPIDPDAAPIACTLAPDQVGGRVADWQATLEQAIAREPIDGGVRVRFAPGADGARLATLAAAEQRCCSFFTFAIRIDAGGVALDVTGPDAARRLLDALIGIAG